MIQCDHVHARAGGFTLRDVTLMVPAGTHAILTGPTASGKTTLLEVIAGWMAATSGELRIAGVDMTTAPPELRRVGLVPQHGYLFPHLDVRHNIGYGARDMHGVTDVARRFGVDDLMDRSVGSLSGGERQLVALCRALAARPAVLLLDEPVSALDRDRRETTLQQLTALQSELGFTMLHVTHHDSDVKAGSMHFEMSNGTVRASH